MTAEQKTQKDNSNDEVNALQKNMDTLKNTKCDEVSRKKKENNFFIFHNFKVEY